MKKIHGKCALITGAASGIGRAIALALAREGVDLFLVDIDGPRLSATADEARRHGVRVVARVADVSQPAEVHAVIAALLESGLPLDILVNNAGIAFYGPTERMTGDQWDQLLAVNLHAPIQFTRELLPILLARPEAHILNVCSILGLVAMPRLAAYHVSKYAMVGLSEALRVEFGPRGLGVTALCPGLVHTNLFEAAKTAPGKAFPRIPSWLCTSPERVADRAVRAIRRCEGVVLITPLAQFVWRFKRFAPGLLDWLQQFRRHRRRPAVAAPAAAPLPERTVEKKAA